MRYAIVLLVLASIQAHAETYHANGKAITKVEALTTLIKDPKATVTKCQELEVSEKATLKIKKVSKK